MRAHTVRIHQRPHGMTPLHLAMLVSFALVPLLAMRAGHILTRAALFAAGILVFIVSLILVDDGWAGGEPARPSLPAQTLSPKP